MRAIELDVAVTLDAFPAAWKNRVIINPTTEPLMQLAPRYADSLSAFKDSWSSQRLCDRQMIWNSAAN